MIGKLVCAGTAVSVGEELVPRPVLRDQALCTERPVYSSWRHLGRDGRMKMFFFLTSFHLELLQILLTYFFYHIRMVTCHLASPWSDSFYMARTSSKMNLEITVKRYQCTKSTFTPINAVHFSLFYFQFLSVLMLRQLAKF